MTKFLLRLIVRQTEFPQLLGSSRLNRVLVSSKFNFPLRLGRLVRKLSYPQPSAAGILVTNAIYKALICYLFKIFIKVPVKYHSFPFSWLVVFISFCSCTAGVHHLLGRLDLVAFDRHSRYFGVPCYLPARGIAPLLSYT